MKSQPQMEAKPRATVESSRWPLSTRIAFRFVFSYFILYIFPGAVGALGADMPHDDAYRQLWHRIVPWVGENLLHLQGDMREIANGSGDQLYDYILLLCFFVVAIVATAVWSWIDRKQENYDQLYQWLRLVCPPDACGSDDQLRRQQTVSHAVSRTSAVSVRRLLRQLLAYGSVVDVHGDVPGVQPVCRNCRNAGWAASDCAPLHHARGAGDPGGDEQRVDAEPCLRRAQENLLDSSGSDVFIPASS